ncbi:zinc transport system substrate-binding protein [Dysgonomonas sp. PH5-45]|uniref:metal ABC transporter solute-binding protein, Zn/Mn family n=1 Tax=unclassified Dysgonomonas TaxID=2630389 RepID=UPI0024741E34|nr:MULTISPECIES: zinc ABC transporter substrate-binding protein [unclassified Dysgonomonas]MDH6354215.1 zinc transport system substrate-binding protein [Dysgonomonas sp. PH5-45]MDH6387116.1 zinc transport system substrate-binding protein [Dysgonomonas sp. PH5-37]
MFKKTSTYFLVSIACCITLFTGCKPDLERKEVIFVSIEPQKFFLEKIVKNNYEIKTIIPDGSNPESYDPAPAQMVDLGKSKLYFKIGYLNFENAWLNNIQKNNPSLKIVNSSEAIVPIVSECGGGHDHEHEHKHSHEGPDPHIWSSPRTARQMAVNMKNEMIEHDATNKDFYEKNFLELDKTISKVDSIFKASLASAPSRSFVIYHPALSYLAEEYNLKQYSIEHQGKQPSPIQLKELIDLAKAENIKIVFVQAEYDQKNAEVIAKQIGARIVTINLMGYNWDEEMIKIAKALAQNNE